MKKSVRIISILLSAIMLTVTVSATAPTLPGQISCTEEVLYPGVTATEYYLAAGYEYSETGPQFLRVLEFDPDQEDLAFDVVMAGPVGSKKTIADIVDDFNRDNTENKSVIAAVNGDLWMMAEYNSRVEGPGEDDPVVKKELCVPRGTDICDGEIICSQNIQQETPFEEMFQSFGITSDGEPLIGNLRVKLKITDVTLGSKSYQTLALNRLPAYNTVVVYSDKGPISNYCLDDAYEVVVDCDYDYKLTAGSTITGTVTAISEPGTERPTMKENRFILTARGENVISKINGYRIGDEITIETTLSDLYGNTEKWQTVTEAVGGHYVALTGGVNTSPQGMYRYDPMTLIGFKPDGNVVIIVNDGRQDWYSSGIVRSRYADLCLDLGLDSVFLLDGGGSTTLVELTEQGYELKNRPSDGATVFTPGIERPCINAVLISAISQTPEYTVTWKNGEETIYSETLEEGSTAVYDGATYGIPEKAEDEEYTYEFAGWDPEPGTVTGNVTYTAVFTAVKKAIPGDLDGDEKVTAKDINLIKKMMTGTIAYLDAADLNGDNKLTVADVNALKKIVTGS